MHIPEYFVHKASRQFGDAGPDWVRSLPALLTRCQKQWQLTDCIPADNLSINLVCYAQSSAYGEVVLKIEGPHTERYTEMAALRLYAGHYACTCFEADEEIAAMLLERVVPGHNLRTLPSKAAQLEIGTELVAGLPIPVNGTCGFPHYGDWIGRAIATTHARYNPDARMKALMTETEALFHEICPGNAPQVLLHGDLHHENMLQRHDGEWRVIDPQGVIGAPFLESARFIQNHVELDGDHAFAVLDETVAYVAERLRETKRAIGGALFILHVLSTCWGYEMNYDSETLARLIDECERLLKYVRAV
mgnify:CR=1 FL=1